MKRWSVGVEVKSTGMATLSKRKAIEEAPMLCNKRQRHCRFKSCSSTSGLTTCQDSLPLFPYLALMTELAPRVIFQTVNTSVVELISVYIQAAKLEVGRSKNNTGDLVVVGRNSVSSTSDSNSPTSGEIGSEARRALGVLGEAMVEGSHCVKASVLVVQAGQEGAA